MPRNSGSPALVDGFGRLHDNLRVSVTDRCNIRCVFCMPGEEAEFAPRAGILSFEEIERFVRIAATLGIRKLRLTGGEPLVRRGLHVLVRKLMDIPGIADVALTTNGVLLEREALALRDAGLRRLNVHLDTLDPARYERLTRRPFLPDVLRGLAAAKRVGFSPIKINAVAMKGEIEDDIVPLVEFGLAHGFQVRFIEVMPLDAGGRWEPSRVLLASEIVALIERALGPLGPAPDQDPRSPASEYVVAGGAGSVGIIASVSRPFCGQCNRIRLTADGRLRNCLFALDELDVRGALRGGASDRDIETLIRRSVGAKWEGHAINSSRFVQPARPMYAIGG